MLFPTMAAAETLPVIQNVNTYVFKKPREVMENIRRVTEYIEHYHPEVNCLHYRTTSLGETYMDMITSFWRVFGYIDSVTRRTKGCSSTRARYGLRKVFQ